ncbi:MAG: hypothetical protein M1830_004528 [Pleopsidium flavum]|nr:MAG: hypothetical protein M1830_004528 [Pleopsidium flavum]
MTAARTTKSTRAKKGRASKTSRTSTQSNLSIVSEAPSVAEFNSEEGNSVLSTFTTATTTSMAPKAGRKGSKAKKTKTGRKSKVSTVNNNEPVEVSSFIEPEDDDFEVKVQDKIVKLSKIRKRTSDEMEGDDGIAQHERQGDEDTLTQAPPPKRRALRTGSSLSRAQHVPVIAHTESVIQDIEMPDAESMPPPIAVPKKGTAGGRKRASSTARKTSTASTASKASLRSAAPEDDEIDAALDAELDRSITDDEAEDEPQGVEKPKSRRLTRTRPGSKKTTASVAPVRKAIRGSTEVQVHPMSIHQEPGDAVAQPMLGEVELDTESQKQDVRAQADTVGLQEKATRRASANQSPVLAGAAQSEDRRPDETVSAEAEKGESQERDEAQTTAHEEALAVAEEVHMDDAALAAAEAIKKETKPGVKAAKGKAKTKTKPEPETAIENSLDQGEERQEPKPAQELVSALAPAPEVKKQTTKSKKAGAAVPKPKGKTVTVTEPSSPPPPSKQTTPSPSPQSSDAENQPPSSRPSATRPPMVSPSNPHTTRIPLAASTPTTSPSKRNIIAGGLQSTFPWTTIDLETIFLASPSSKNDDKENTGLTEALKSVKGELRSPEKKMSVEEWIAFNASQGEERLRRECERLVGIFEGQGVRALRTLEGLECVQ